MNSVRRLANWCKRPSPLYTLAVGSTCGCEMAQLERDIRDHLNHRLRRRDGQFGAFDCEDIRCYAGHPEIRRFIIKSSRHADVGAEEMNDYEVVLRGLASMGGVVIGGQAALDATRRYDHVFRVVLSRGGRFDADELTTCLNPDRCGPKDCLVAMIADSFLDWASAPERGMGEVREKFELPEFKFDEFEGEGELEPVGLYGEYEGKQGQKAGVLTRSWR